MAAAEREISDSALELSMEIEESCHDIEVPVSGVLVTRKKDDWCTERSTIGILSFQRESVPPNERETSIDQTFCSRHDEATFLSCCHFGPEFLSQIDKILHSTEGKLQINTNEVYRSKLRHIWLTVARLTYVANQPLTLTPEVIHALHDLKRVVENEHSNTQTYCMAFLEKYGSHVLKGPIQLGGRLIKKVTCLEYPNETGSEEFEAALDEFFEGFIQEENSAFDSIIHVKRRCNSEEIIPIESQLMAEPVPEAFRGLGEWKQMVLDAKESNKIIGYTISNKSLIPVWEFIRNNGHTFGEHTFGLATNLFQTWKTLTGFETMEQIPLYPTSKLVFHQPGTVSALAKRRIPLVQENVNQEANVSTSPHKVEEAASGVNATSNEGVSGENLTKEISEIGGQNVTESSDANSISQSTRTDTANAKKEIEIKDEKVIDADCGNPTQNISKKQSVTAEEPQSSQVKSSIQMKAKTQQKNEEVGRDDRRAEIRDLLLKLGLLEDYPNKAKREAVLALTVDESEEEVKKTPARKILQKLMCLDFRGRRGLPAEHVVGGINGEEKKDFEEGDIFATYEKNSSVEENYPLPGISTNDVLFALYHCCDPFLLQELIYKMSECQIAVPLLLPHFEPSRITFLLWGLRKIQKKWRSPLHSNTIIDKSVVSYPIPVVSFIRVGSPPLSKSKLLNRIIGPMQGNNEHPFFTDNEHDIAIPRWSKGTVEVVWYTPEGGDGSVEIFTNAAAFLNLRGNSSHFLIQRKFMCELSEVTVALLDGEKTSFEEVRTLAPVTKNLVVIMNGPIVSGRKQRKTQTKGNTTIIDGSGRSIVDLCGEVCAKLKDIISSDGSNSLEMIADKCLELGIEVDEKKQECVLGKTRASSVLASTYETNSSNKRSPAAYKRDILPLQTSLWKKWAALDKKSEKLVQSQKHESIEHVLDRIKGQKLKLRKKQVGYPIANEVLEFINALNSNEQNLRKYFLAWSQSRLNEMSRESLGPLNKELRKLQTERRELGGTKRELEESLSKQENKEGKQAMQSEIDQISKIEEGCLKKIKSITKQFDDNSLGPEHFMRELGQIYEAYAETKEVNTNNKFDAKRLPHLAADMLMDGHPLEILDGDVGHVPIRWVQSVFQSVIEKLNNPSVYVVSVVGIQSSGKSTLLNNMFGINFAVSAGRCTRGVFIQMIPVQSSHIPRVGCDYIIVVDTEGLKAPERAIMEGNHHDNELATFALCLSDLTLINISGQTVGQEMTDILQIAAHAFIRMKEVNLKSSCRIVQQFVSDLSAVDRNETGTQSILVKLDEATAAAAEEEGLGKRYQRFSDVFSLELDVNLQYIPNLYGGSMSPPNHRYSEAILRLREALIKDIKGSSRELASFQARVIDVWRAVKEEEFIFSFQSSLEALQYKQFQVVYGQWISEMSQTVLEWEAKTKQMMKNTNEPIETVRRRLKNEVPQIIASAKSHVEEKMHSYLYENVKDEDILHKHEREFCKDLDLIEKDMRTSVRDNIDFLADALIQANDIHLLLPKCRLDLRSKAQQEAINLRKKYKGVDELQLQVGQLEETFERLWVSWIDEIEKKYPANPAKIEDVTKQFDSYITQQGSKADLTKELKKKLQTGGKGLRGFIREKWDHFWHEMLNSETELVKAYIHEVVIKAMTYLDQQIEYDMAYDPNLVQQLIFKSINDLSQKQQAFQLNNEQKANAIIYICSQAIAKIFQGRQDYDERYSLRNLLLKEKVQLRNDFKALCLDRFQDQRAVERFLIWLKEGLVDEVNDSAGVSIYRMACEKHGFLTNKSSFLGTVLRDIGEKGDFSGYYKYIFEHRKFLSEWTLHFLSKAILEPYGTAKKTLLDHLVLSKVDSMIEKILEELSSTAVPLQEDEAKENDGGYKSWLDEFLSKYQTAADIVCETDKFEVLKGFDVKNLQFFKEQVIKLVKTDLKEEVVEASELTNIASPEKALPILQKLSLKPHLEIVKFIQGCGEQCPFCKAPCDILTKNHDKHRSELHYPEGIIGCALIYDESLSCNICTSSVSSDESYTDTGGARKQYKNYQREFPTWYIQPVKEDTPNMYWRWVLWNFNEKFAELFGRKKANVPTGWKQISKAEALRSLAEAYALQV